MTAEPKDTSVANALTLDGDADAIKDFYGRWAASYDNDMAAQYDAARFIAQTVHELMERSDGFNEDPAACRVFDAGCGTGLVGVAMAGLGYTQIDGVDISAEMVEEARKTGAYNELVGDVDLNQPLASDWQDRYDITTSCGVFTLGHVPPDALRHLIHVTRAQGLIAVSTRQAYFDDSGFGSVVDGMIGEGLIELAHEHRDGPYTADSTAHYFVYRVR